ncbi:WD40 repeat domain-containing protein [Phototrophicus methaneseepsis]|uniref:WD40 repeat domain-containing protein n=1 Tax=Phototrophicus methaneseepsis TaxID=2710758 RepID=A0A7S8IFU6_9CHLR|nr:WD40 repeat domain-containing protein [Phototrophicus methaneseepsis]QPC83986.1 WD40 repeat domain-containing protein [Phototrophicus methaneseepsis]
MNKRRTIGLFLLSLCTFLTPLLVQGQESIFGTLPFPPITPRNASNVVELATLGAGTVQTVAWSHDGEMIAVGTSVGVWIYDAPFEPDNRYLLTSATESILKAAFSPDDKLVATISRDQNLSLWDVQTGRNVFTGFHGGVQDVAFNSTSTSLVTVGQDSNMIFWNLDTGAQDMIISAGVGLNAVTFSPDDTQVYGGDTNGDLHVWDIETSEEVLSRPAHEGAIYALDVQPNGGGIISGGEDGVIRLWDVALDELINFIRGSSRVNSIVFGTNSSILTVTRANTPQIWDLTSGDLSQTFDGHDGIVVSAAFNQDASQLISGSTDGTVRIWDIATGEQQMLFEGFTGSFNSAAFSPTLAHIAAGSNSGLIKVWELNNLSNVTDLSGHFGPVTALTFSPDGRILASGSDDRTIRLWSLDEDSEAATVPETFTQEPETTEEDTDAEADTDTGTTEEDTDPFANTTTTQPNQTSDGSESNVLVLQGVTSAVSALTFTPDGRSLISAGADGIIITWDPITGEQKNVYNSSLSDIVHVAFTDNTSVLAAISSNGDVETWNQETGERVNTFSSGSAESFISPNKLILAYVIGRNVQLVELSTQAWLRDLRSHTADINNVAISEDGTLIATCSDDGTVRIWAVPTS